MSATVISLKVEPYRILSKREAANYCKISVRDFPIRCPVRPLNMGRGEMLYDVRDLDRWIDSFKGAQDGADDIIGRLG
jgi:hypothetical protein